MNRRRTAILISGRGSNMASLLAAGAREDFPARIVAVLSNRPAAPGLARAAAAGIHAEAIDHKGFADRAGFERALDARLRDLDVDLICLAGFMRLLTADFVTAWRDRLLNIHPSLLPAFPGLDTHARALAAGVRFAGCTVHLVRPEMDAGPILAQACVPVLPGDDAQSLASRVLAAEHRLYPAALALYAAGAARVEEERIVYRDGIGFPHATAFAPAPD
jgi:phosphoribosylglycinamide formyltransferase-1